MRELSGEELKKIQIGILDYTAALCEKNNLSYWLDYGSLIGAIRHKGYIPWDDDIDISMLRKDYDRLIEICREKQDDRYRFECIELNPDYPYTYGKMLDKDTLVYEMGEHGLKTNVYVDVFVYDDAPSDEKEREKAYRKLRHYSNLRRFQFPMGEGPLTVRRLFGKLIRLVFKCLPKQYFVRKIVKQSRKYKETESNLVFDISSPDFYKPWCVEKAVFQELIDVEFEGKKYKAPRRYDEWLRMQYGDYMKIPSEEQQNAAKHNMKAYIL